MTADQARGVGRAKGGRSLIWPPLPRVAIGDSDCDPLMGLRTQALGVNSMGYGIGIRRRAE